MNRLPSKRCGKRGTRGRKTGRGSEAKRVRRTSMGVLLGGEWRKWSEMGGMRKRNVKRVVLLWEDVVILSL